MKTLTFPILTNQSKYLISQLLNVGWTGAWITDMGRNLFILILCLLWFRPLSHPICYFTQSSSIWCQLDQIKTLDSFTLSRLSIDSCFFITRLQRFEIYNRITKGVLSAQTKVYKHNLIRALVDILTYLLFIFLIWKCILKSIQEYWDSQKDY
jgi:hypothetical protein